jgi:hypothetical protein
MPTGPMKATDKEKHFYKKSITPKFTDKPSSSEPSRVIQSGTLLYHSDKIGFYFYS